MVQVKTYYLPPTKLIPNSPQPLLHYPGFLLPEKASSSSSSSSISTSKSKLTSGSELEKSNAKWESESREPAPTCSAVTVHDLFRSNKWHTQWIFRYGTTQRSHYHSQVHECMAVLSGQATIRFGVADVYLPADLETLTTDSNDTHTPTHARDPSGQETGGIEIEAKTGDVFVLPAGVAHKTFDTQPIADFALLTPGDGHHVASIPVGPSRSVTTGIRHGDDFQTRMKSDTYDQRADDDSNYDDNNRKQETKEKEEENKIRTTLQQIKLSGFTMIGAYPDNSQAWDFAKGGENDGEYDRVWSTPKPERDPVLGTSVEGLCGLWREDGSHGS